MANRKAEGKPQDPWPDVLAAVAALQKGHEVGRTVRDQLGDRADRGKISEVAKTYDLTIDATRKLRQFAVLYDADDLAELCDLCRTYHRALGITFVYRLVGIPNKSRRKAFQRKAIKQHWGHARFVRELRRGFKHGHKRGRQPQLPETISEALAEIGEVKERFMALLDHCTNTVVRTKGTRQEKQRLGQVAQQLLDAIKGVEAPDSPAAHTGRRRGPRRT